MALKIPTNNTGLTAGHNFNYNISKLSKSIEKLSSGLRVNRPADDTGSFFQASGLDSQALALGRAMANANEGVSMMQVANSVLDQAIDILTSVKSKAEEAARDTLTASGRDSLQIDINKLLDELDILVNSTSYNDRYLLRGLFADQKFQVGARGNENLSVSLDPASSPEIGLMNTSILALSSTAGGDVQLNFYSNLYDTTLNIDAISMQYNNDADNGMGGLAEIINKYSGTTGISGVAEVESTSAGAVQSGATESYFAINDIPIGTVNTQANDASASLVTAINTRTDSHGVTAAVDSSGRLTLTSGDGRAIKVSGLGSALADTDTDMTTFGYVRIFQEGPYAIDLTDRSSGLAVGFTANLGISGDLTTTIDSTLAAGSVLGAASVLKAGWTAGAVLSGNLLNGNIVTTADSSLPSGSTLASGTIIKNGSILGGTAYNNGGITTTDYSLLRSGSVIESGSIIKAGTYLTNTVYSGGSPVAAGQTLTNDTTLSSDAALTRDMLLASGSTIGSGSKFTAASYIGGDITLSGAMSTTEDMTLLAGSTITDQDGITGIAAGAGIGGDATLASAPVTLTGEMTLKSGSTLTDGSSLAPGSTLGGDVTLNESLTAAADLSLAAGSQIAAGSLIKEGTLLTNDILTYGHGRINSGATLTMDYNTLGVNTLTNDMTVKSGSILADGTILAANPESSTPIELSGSANIALADLSVLTLTDAEAAVTLVDAALSRLNDIRSGAAATQEQLNYSVSALEAGKLNIQGAKSAVMDVDFAEEAANFAKLQTIVQTGAFALIQANARTANVLPLLQGEGFKDFYNLLQSTAIAEVV